MVHLTHRRDRSQLTEFPIPADSPADGLNAADGLNVEVRLFAAAADWADTRQVRLHVAPGGSLREVRLRLVELYPALQSLASVSRWAVDEQFVSDDFVLHSHATIAMIPPVSGG